MEIIECTFDHVTSILNILNHAILHTTAIYDYDVRTPAMIEAWVHEKHAKKYPILGCLNNSGEFVGFATYGSFRPHAAYQYTVENSIYIDKKFENRGFATFLLEHLIQYAQRKNLHTMIACIDSENSCSIHLHTKFGFTKCGSFVGVGFKFGKWIGVDFYQLLL